MKPEEKKIPVPLPNLAKMYDAMLFNARVDTIGAYGHNIDEAPEIKSGTVMVLIAEEKFGIKLPAINPLIHVNIAHVESEYNLMLYPAKGTRFANRDIDQPFILAPKTQVACSVDKTGKAWELVRLSGSLL